MPIYIEKVVNAPKEDEENEMNNEIDLQNKNRKVLEKIDDLLNEKINLERLRKTDGHKKASGLTRSTVDYS